MTAPLNVTAELRKADGYWTSRRLEIWRGLTPEQRDHDRYVGWYPPGQGAMETESAWVAVAQQAELLYEEEHACRCHLNPPCWHCTDCLDCAEVES